MPTMNTLTGRDALLQEIYAAVTSVAGLPLGGSRLGLMPTAQKITSAGFPFLVVLPPSTGLGADPMGGPGVSPVLLVGHNTYMPVGDYDVICMYPYNEDDDGLALTASHALDLLEQAVINVANSLQHAYQIQILDPHVGHLWVGNSASPLEITSGQPFYEAALTIRAFSADDIT